MEIRPLRASELEQAWELDRDSFNSAPELREFFLRWEPERLTGALDGSRLVGLSGSLPFGQFFGRRRVPMGGLSAVSVAADRRGEGLAQQVVTACLAAMRERGEVISSLYPATTSLYRILGWEVAGGVAWRSVEPARLTGLPKPAGVTVRPADDADRDAMRACYARLAVEMNGWLDRPESWWELREQRAREASRYVVLDATDSVVGYLIYAKRHGTYGATGPFRLAVEDFVWTSRDAGLALLRLLASWSAQVETVYYRGGVEDPVQLLLPEQPARTVVDMRWMTRVVDVEGAVAARGFPAGFDVSVPFELSDPQLPANAGPRVLHVSKGQGSLETGGPGGPRLDVGAFSSLYTGWADTATLARAGRLVGGAPEERALLDAAFAGAAPSVHDEF